MNQTTNEGELKITKGTTKTYTYKGDSGKSRFELCFPRPDTAVTDVNRRQSGPLLLLPKLHRAYIPPPNGLGP